MRKPILKIGSEEGVKEKLLEIKNALPDFKKTLVKQIDGSGSYEVNMKIGNGTPLFDEHTETKEQTITVNFSGSPYFNGTIKDFQLYFTQLSTWLKEIFGETHEFQEGKETIIWTLTGVEKGKDFSNSPTLIDLEVTWILDNPDINLTISTNPGGKH